MGITGCKVVVLQETGRTPRGSAARYEQVSQFVGAEWSEIEKVLFHAKNSVYSHQSDLKNISYLSDSNYTSP